MPVGMAVEPWCSISKIWAVLDPGAAQVSSTYTCTSCLMRFSQKGVPKHCLHVIVRDCPPGALEE